MKTCQIALTLAAVVIVNHCASMIHTADAFTTAAFVPSTTLQQRGAFLKATVVADNNDAKDKGPLAFEKTSFLDRLVHRKQQAKEALETKAQSLKEKAQAMKLRAKENLHSLETKLELAIQEETDELINLIALDAVRLFHGHWDCYVVTTDMNDANTKNNMERNMEELASDFVALGLEEENNKSLLKEELKDSRLRITQSFDGSDYPLRLQQEVFLGSEPVVQLYGQLQFDLLEHTAVYALDELVVLGTTVDLKEIIQAQAAAMEEEEAVADMGVAATEEDQDVLMEDIAFALKEEQEAEVAEGMEGDRLVWAIEQLEG